jgi:DUF971 family protein
MNAPQTTRIWPQEIRLNPEKSALALSFTDGVSGTLEAELLRVMSPSAEVQGHSPSERKLISGKRAVKIMQVEPIGNYAVRLEFSDGHSTGIYTWVYLHGMTLNKAQHWETYLREIADSGLNRDRS